MPSETSIQLSIVKALKKKGAWAVKIHGGPMQTKVVDILACYRGIFIAIEVKRPGLDATVIQQDVLDDVVRHGGFAIVAHNVEEALALLDSLDEKFRVWRKERKRLQRGKLGI
jgi:Holliday junction resolvase